MPTGAMKNHVDELRELVRLTRDYLERFEGQSDCPLAVGVIPRNEAAPTEFPPGTVAVSPPPAGEQGGSRAPGLGEIEKGVSKCRKCALWKTREKTVCGTGASDARVFFVGEAPGAEEDRQGLPFVGRAGQLLTKMLGAIGLERGDVYITNVLKCRPPGNRDPHPDEVACCEPYLLAQLELIKPRLICALGRHAAQTLLKTDTGISKLRGHFHDYHGVKILPTYHPAYLLRNPADKSKAWEDLKKVKAFLDER